MNSEKTFWVYITASRMRGTLYIGVTSDLVKRIWQHKNKVHEGFTAEYGVDRLMWYEPHGNAESAIVREKQLKKWNRALEDRVDREGERGLGGFV